MLNWLDYLDTLFKSRVELHASSVRLAGVDFGREIPSCMNTLMNIHSDDEVNTSTVKNTLRKNSRDDPWKEISTDLWHPAVRFIFFDVISKEMVYRTYTSVYLPYLQYISGNWSHPKITHPLHIRYTSFTHSHIPGFLRLRPTYLFFNI